MLFKENTEFKEIIDELHRGIGKFLGGINKDSWNSISGIRGIVKQIEENKPINFYQHSIMEDS